MLKFSNNISWMRIRWCHDDVKVNKRFLKYRKIYEHILCFSIQNQRFFKLLIYVSTICSKMGIVFHVHLPQLSAYFERFEVFVFRWAHFEDFSRWLLFLLQVTRFFRVFGFAPWMRPHDFFHVFPKLFFAQIHRVSEKMLVVTKTNLFTNRLKAYVDHY